MVEDDLVDVRPRDDGLPFWGVETAAGGWVLKHPRHADTMAKMNESQRESHQLVTEMKTDPIVL